ncbi:MAG: serine hydrolase domain-containing protein [Phycisphaerales bacterium JB040]
MLTRTLSSGAAALSLLVGCTAHSLAQDDFEGTIERARERGTLHGCVAVIAGGEIVHESCDGLLVEPDGEVITRDTRFRIASLTKLFTQVAVLRLVDAGELSLDDTVSQHRPAFDASWADRVTVGQLLAMTSGLPRELHGRPDVGVEFDAGGFAGPYLDEHGGVALEGRPGGASSYSNLGYWVLGAIVESVTGEPYAEAVRSLVFVPAGLDSTGMGPESLGEPPRAAGHQRAGGGIERGPDFAIDMRYSSGGLESTIGDLERLALALLGGELLSAESTDLLFTGFGEDDDGRVLVAGMLPGFMNMIILDRDAGTAVISLNNSVAENPNLFMRLMESLERRAGRVGG